MEVRNEIRKMSPQTIIELNPCEYEQLKIEEVADHRNLRCKYYPTCLLYAGIAKWVGFTCSNCQEFTNKGEDDDSRS